MRKTKSSILEAVHETALVLHQAGAMDQVTLREFERLCLPPVEPLKPEQIKQIRENSRVSQAVFARLLNTSTSPSRSGKSARSAPRELLSNCSIWCRSAVWKLWPEAPSHFKPLRGRPTFHHGASSVRQLIEPLCELGLGPQSMLERLNQVKGSKTSSLRS